MCVYCHQRFAHSIGLIFAVTTAYICVAYHVIYRGRKFARVLRFAYFYVQFPEMECGRSKQKQRKFANISDDYGDGDLELSDSDENVDEVHVTRESKRNVSYISKSDSGQHPQTGLYAVCANT